MEDGLKKLRSALIEYNYNQAITGFVSSLVCAVIVLIAIFNERPKILIFSWLAFFLLVMALRFLLIKVYQKSKLEVDYKIWSKLYIWGAALAGISWGLAGWLLPTQVLLKEVIVILVMTGVAAGSVPLMSGIRSALVAFLAPFILLIVLHLWLLNNYLQFLLSLTILLYLFYLITLSVKFNKVLVKSISLQFENEALLEHLKETATHDPLTKVANRGFLMSELDNAKKRADRNKKYLACVYLDLDRFKHINDTYGHDVGDELLITMTKRINHLIRKSDVIGRLGGDEFVLILEDIVNPSDIVPLLDSILMAISETFIFGELKINMTASIGISLYPLDEIDLQKLIKNADEAMYKVKRKSGNGFLFFNMALNHRMGLYKK